MVFQWFLSKSMISSPATWWPVAGTARSTILREKSLPAANIRPRYKVSRMILYGLLPRGNRPWSIIRDTLYRQTFSDEKMIISLKIVDSASFRAYPGPCQKPMKSIGFPMDSIAIPAVPIFGCTPDCALFQDDCCMHFRGTPFYIKGGTPFIWYI